jgi:dTMP kinase
MPAFNPAKGLFVTFEGPEGSGKTTQKKLLSERLQKLGHDLVLTREPGGTAIGEHIRTLLLSPRNTQFDRMAEIFLFMADRSQHLSEVVLPAIQAGKVILCDRYVDSTLAYQVGGRKMSETLLLDLNALSSQGLTPQRTYLFRVLPEIGLRRATQNGADRFEIEKLDFHQRVLDKYLQLAEQAPQRILVLDATQSIESIHGQIWEDFQKLLAQHGQ